MSKQIAVHVPTGLARAFIKADWTLTQNYAIFLNDSSPPLRTEFLVLRTPPSLPPLTIFVETHRGGLQIAKAQPEEAVHIDHGPTDRYHQAIQAAHDARDRQQGLYSPTEVGARQQALFSGSIPSTGPTQWNGVD